MPRRNRRQSRAVRETPTGRSRTARRGAGDEQGRAQRRSRRPSRRGRDAGPRARTNPGARLPSCAAKARVWDERARSAASPGPGQRPDETTLGRRSCEAVSTTSAAANLAVCRAWSLARERMRRKRHLSSAVGSQQASSIAVGRGRFVRCGGAGKRTRQRRLGRERSTARQRPRTRPHKGTGKGEGVGWRAPDGCAKRTSLRSCRANKVSLQRPWRPAGADGRVSAAEAI